MASILPWFFQKKNVPTFIESEVKPPHFWATGKDTPNPGGISPNPGGNIKTGEVKIANFHQLVISHHLQPPPKKNLGDLDSVILVV